MARERQNQVKDYVSKAVEEISKQLAGGASLHQLAEQYGVRERHQTQALPPFKGRATSAVLICSAPDLTLSMGIQTGVLEVRSDDGRVVKAPDDAPLVAIADRCFDALQPCFLGACLFTKNVASLFSIKKKRLQRHRRISRP